MAAKGISLDPEQRKAFDYLFNQADKDQLGVLTGDKAVPFFDSAQLPPQTLGEIWALADDENTGFLTKDQFSAVCRMIGHAQNGQEPSIAMINRPGPMPSFKGFHIPGLAKQPTLPASGSTGSVAARALSPTPTGNGRSSPARQTSTPVPQTQQQQQGGITISLEDKAKYTRLFYNSGASNGLLDGDKARDILMKSRLPNEQLGQIWNLADTQSRGALDATDFVIAMALINATMSGKLRSLPDTLPVSVYAQAASGSAPPTTAGAMPGSPLRAQMTGASAAPLYPQNTGGYQPNRSVGAGSTLGASTNSSNWAITPLEKTQSDQFFQMLDTSRSGYIGGDIAVPFFIQSGLPEDTLAAIWDLSDISKEGRLNKDEFAVARRLIMDALAGKAVPSTLEESMIPPSLRSTARQMQNQPQQSEVQKDLFSLMDDDDEPAPTLPAAAASAFQQPPPQQQQFSNRVASPSPLMPQATGGSSRGIPAPMIPTHTGGSARSGSMRSAPPPIPATRSASVLSSPPSQPAARQGGRNNTFETNFGEDSDDEAPLAQQQQQKPQSPPVDRSAEVVDLKKQVGQTQRSVSTLRDQRTKLADDVAKVDTEIDELKVKLGQAKAAYDVESTNMTNLEARQKTGGAELKRLRNETITAESDLSALKEQKIELEQGILKDKEEVRGLKSTLKTTNDELAQLKEELERLKKEGRQQKGLLAVSRKQLTTAEGEREKLQRDTEQEKAEQQQAASAAREVPLPASNVVSPTPSTGSGRSMNPFFAAGGLAAPVAAVAARALSPLGASGSQTTEEPSRPTEEVDEDPFGMSKSGTIAPPEQQQQQAGSGGFGFDDDFGSSFGPSGDTSAQQKHTDAAGTLGHISNNMGFDDAFAEFDKPSAPGGASGDVGSTEQKHNDAVGTLGNIDNNAGFNDAFAEFDKPSAPAAETTQNQRAASPSSPPHHDQPEHHHHTQGSLATAAGIGAATAGVAGLALGGAAIGGAGAVAGAAIGAGGVLAASPGEEKENEMSAPLDKGKGREIQEPERAMSPPSAMQPYESRAVPQEQDEESDGDLPPIQDIDRPASMDSDSEDDTAEDVPRAGGVSREPTSTSPSQDLYEGHNEPGDIHSSSRAVDFHAIDHAGGPANDQQAQSHTMVPGAFPSGAGSAPSSVGDADEAFEDARSSSFVAQSASPPSTATASEFPSSSSPPTANTGSANLDEALSRSREPTARGSAMGFDDAFGSTPVSGLPPTSHDSFLNNDGASGGFASAPIVVTKQPPVSDDFDDFEDLAPARIEGSSGAEPQGNNSFNDNFDDDFGFDNQTFSHTITSQGVGKSTEPAGVVSQQPLSASHSRGPSGGSGSGGFDDAFDDAFAVPSSNNGGAAPPLPQRPAAAGTGFDDDFFGSPTSAQPASSTAPSSDRNYPLPPGAAPSFSTPEFTMYPVTSSSSAAAPASSSFSSPPRSNEPAPAASSGPPPVAPGEPAPSYAPPPGPPPRQAQSQRSIPAPPVPSRSESDGDLPAVRELTAMGFKRSQAIAALEDNQFNVERAANALLAVNQ